MAAALGIGLGMRPISELWTGTDSESWIRVERDGIKSLKSVCACGGSDQNAGSVALFVREGGCDGGC